MLAKPLRYVIHNLETTSTFASCRCRFMSYFLPKIHTGPLSVGKSSIDTIPLSYVTHAGDSKVGCNVQSKNSYNNKTCGTSLSGKQGVSVWSGQRHSQQTIAW